MRKNTVRGDALILTVSDEIEQLDYLLENLPDICFHIAAPVQFSEKIRRLETNFNVRLMTVTTHQQIDFLSRLPLALKPLTVTNSSASMIIGSR